MSGRTLELDGCTPRHLALAAHRQERARGARKIPVSDTVLEAAVRCCFRFYAADGETPSVANLTGWINGATDVWPDPAALAIALLRLNHAGEIPLPAGETWASLIVDLPLSAAPDLEAAPRERRSQGGDA